MPSLACLLWVYGTCHTPYERVSSKSISPAKSGLRRNLSFLTNKGKPSPSPRGRGNLATTLLPSCLALYPKCSGGVLMYSLSCPRGFFLLPALALVAVLALTLACGDDSDSRDRSEREDREPRSSARESSSSDRARSSSDEEPAEPRWNIRGGSGEQGFEDILELIPASADYLLAVDASAIMRRRSSRRVDDIQEQVPQHYRKIWILGGLRHSLGGRGHSGDGRHI